MTFKKSIVVVHNRSLYHMKLVSRWQLQKGIDLHNLRTSGDSVSLDIRMVANYPTEFYEFVKHETIPANSIFIVGENILLQADAITLFTSWPNNNGTTNRLTWRSGT
jgi:hypothetical protein